MNIILLLLLFVGLLLFFLVLSVPVAFSLLFTGLIALTIDIPISTNYQIIAGRMFHSLNSFVLIAVPFFIFAARIMNREGITEGIFNFTGSIVGHWKGGLGYANVIASVIFAGMSGSAVSDAAGLGIVELKAMKDAGYDDDFSLAITAASSTIGPIIPPSIPMVIYAAVAGVSVGKLFIGGIVPGLLMAISLMISINIYSRKKNFPYNKAFSGRLLIGNFKTSFLALLTPIIILGGIFSGFCTPTEASVIAIWYAFLLGIFIYRKAKFSKIINDIKETAKDTASLSFIVACAGVYGWLLLRSGLPVKFTSLLLSVTNNATLLMLLIVLFLLILGCFMEPISILLILTPLFMPLVNAANIDPVYFGIIMILTLMIGLLTPPFGVVLFTLSRVGNVPLHKVIKSVWIFMIPLTIVVLLMTIFPQIVLYLPNLIYD